MRDSLAMETAELVRARIPFTHAIVVRAQHPTSAHAGDTAIVLADGRISGFVGGSCAEESVLTYGLRVLQTGSPLLLRILPGPAGTTEEDGAVTVVNPCLSGGALEIFLEPRRPAPRIVLVGETPVGQALVALAEPLGFAVDLMSGQEAASGSAAVRPDDAALVVASHGRGEEPALEAALRAGVPYVALVGSRIRAAEVLARLDVTAAQRARVHSPAGLDIGARSAAEIALSIVAELVAERARLRDQAASALADPPAATTAIDPVCGMLVSTVGNALVAKHAGHPVYFCSEHCRLAFAADPTRHVAAS